MYPKMCIIIFSVAGSAEKILSRSKVMTARFWRKTPPKVGSLFRAQRGRAKSTAFAICEVVSVREWNGFDIPEAYNKTSPFMPYPEIERRRQVIAIKEGFVSWYQFIQVYQSLNKHHWNDPERTHYFIEFKVKEFVNATSSLDAVGN